MKKRWKHLKDQYRKELKKQPILRSGSESEPWESTWQYFNLMSFAKDELIPASSSGNLSNNEIETLETENIETHSDTEMMAPASPVLSQPIPSPIGSSASQTSSSFRKRTNIRDDMLEIEKKKLLLMETRLKDNQEEEKLKNDEDFLFLKSILPNMKKLSDLQKLRFRGKINDWLIEAFTENERAYYQNQAYYSGPGTSGSNRGYYTQPDVTELTVELTQNTANM